MGAAAWLAVHATAPANENDILRVAKSLVHTHNGAGPRHPLHPPRRRLHNPQRVRHTMSRVTGRASHREPQRERERESGRPTGPAPPAPFMSAYQHPSWILSCFANHPLKERTNSDVRAHYLWAVQRWPEPLSRSDKHQLEGNAHLDHRKAASDTLAKCAIGEHSWEGVGGTVACYNHCCIKITSFMTAPGQAAAVWPRCRW